MFQRAGHALLLFHISHVVSQQYQLVQTYNAENFFEDFNFFTGADPTGGFVDYVSHETASQLGLIRNYRSSVYIGVDTTNTYPPNGPGRQSVRLESKETFTEGLFVLDLTHIPVGCGTWPAFWTGGLGDSPTDGEIAGVCEVDEAIEQYGTWTSTDCNVQHDGNQGCGSDLNDPNNYGADFNVNGGGVYAMEWTNSTINIWFFRPGEIPQSLTVASFSPNLAEFGIPSATFAGPCSDSFGDKFFNHSIIIETTFCGGWAGEVFGTGDTTCQKAPGTTSLQSCIDFVGQNPWAFTEAYWSIKSLRVWQKGEGTTEELEDFPYGGTEVPIPIEPGIGDGSGPEAFGDYTTSEESYWEPIPTLIEPQCSEYSWEELVDPTPEPGYWEFEPIPLDPGIGDGTGSGETTGSGYKDAEATLPPIVSDGYGTPYEEPVPELPFYFDPIFPVEPIPYTEPALPTPDTSTQYIDVTPIPIVPEDLDIGDAIAAVLSALDEETRETLYEIVAPAMLEGLAPPIDDSYVTDPIVIIDPVYPEPIEPFAPSSTDPETTVEGTPEPFLKPVPTSSSPPTSSLKSILHHLSRFSKRQNDNTALTSTPVNPTATWASIFSSLTAEKADLLRDLLSLYKTYNGISPDPADGMGNYVSYITEWDEKLSVFDEETQGAVLALLAAGIPLPEDIEVVELDGEGLIGKLNGEGDEEMRVNPGFAVPYEVLNGGEESGELFELLRLWEGLGIETKEAILEFLKPGTGRLGRRQTAEESPSQTEEEEETSAPGDTLVEETIIDPFMGEPLIGGSFITEDTDTEDPTIIELYPDEPEEIFVDPPFPEVNPAGPSSEEPADISWTLRSLSPS
ncbi:glycoside hydrolase family 16 protein [Sporormia fimetaria CBS 119925]|uniref:endo-1,3(4)-beta-glucanase n=1 Tax=Sporormia fimetaria CBS 119925 TaxID=1340428 RepID=A0A6A6VLH4_9PLEO|nr:glycoside hydrolase family 16 protein [Sporormia fimetaria CBS 119925]